MKFRVVAGQQALLIGCVLTMLRGLCMESTGPNCRLLLVAVRGLAIGNIPVYVVHE